MLLRTIATLVICFTLVAFSQPAQAAKPKMDDETWQEMHALKGQQSEAKAKERLLKLKTALQLRDDQMAAWSEYEKYMLKAAETKHMMRGEMRERRMQRQAPPNSLELAEHNVTRLERQLAHAKERLTVFSGLYNSLDDEQRQKLDKLAHRKVRRHAREHRERAGKMGGKHGERQGNRN